MMSSAGNKRLFRRLPLAQSKEGEADDQSLDGHRIALAFSGAVALAKQTPVQRESLALVNAHIIRGSIGAIGARTSVSLELCATELFSSAAIAVQCRTLSADWSGPCSIRGAEPNRAASSL